MGYLIIILVCFCVYSSSLKYGIVVDDIANRKKHDNPEVEIKRPLWLKVLRNLDGNYPVKSIFSDHILTFIIHTSVCLLMYCAFESLEASLLFAVNVGNNQVSLWLNGKRYGINTLLCLLAYLFMPIGLVFWLLTPFFQVNALTFPIILSLYKHWSFFLIIPVAFLIGNKYLLKWMRYKKKTMKAKSLTVWNIRKIVFMMKTYAYYFIHGVVPYFPTMYPIQFKRFGLINEDTKETYRINTQFFAGLFLVLFIIYVYFIDKIFFFGLVWWFVAISIFSNWITLTVPLAERYMYLPNVGLMLFFTKILNLVHPQLWMLVFVIYTTRLITFMPMYKNMGKFLKHHQYHQPTDDQCWIFDANRHADLGDFFGVAYLANEGLVANQDSSWLWLHRAIGFARVGLHDLAQQALDQAKKYARDDFGEIVSHKIDEVEKLINNIKEKRS